MIERIAKAYLKSKEQQKKVDEILLPGHWKNLIQKKQDILKPLIENKEYANIEKLLETFLQNKELIEGFSESFNIGMFTSEYERWKIFDVGDIEDAEVPKIGKPHYFTVGTYISDDNKKLVLNPIHTNIYSLRFHKLANTVANLLKQIDGHPIIAELGPGYGGITYYLMKKTNRKMTYILYDLPETNVISSYYLTKLFPKKTFLFYGEDNERPLTDYDIIILPNFELQKLENEYIDLFISIRTLGESMNLDSVDFYTTEIMRILKIGGYFLHERCNNAPDDYMKKFDRRLTMLYETRALFHNTCNYEYLFKKRVHPPAPVLVSILVPSYQ